MMESVFAFSRYFVALLFGAAVAVSFAGMERTQKNRIATGCLAIVLFIFQFFCLRTWGMKIP